VIHITKKWFTSLCIVALWGTIGHLAIGIEYLLKQAQFSLVLNREEGIINLAFGAACLILLILALGLMDRNPNQTHVDYYEKENQRLRGLLKGKWV
jgi:dipeptide/tripeptide permease